MEIRAPYAFIGLFVLTAIVAVFGFVYWLHNTGGLGERTVYRVRFENSVSGLLKGAAVLFNGVRVGEVTDLQLTPENPRQVMVTIAVAPTTPVRTDTQVDLDFQGLTGVPVVTLAGGNMAAPALTSSRGEPPVLVAGAAAGQSMTQIVRLAAQRLETMLADNAEALRNTIANLSTFAAALARNSDRVDTILAGLEKMTGGGTTKPPPIVYDLTAPRTFPASNKVPRGQLVVPEPTALVMFDTQNILVRPSAGGSSTVANAQWSDSLPKLVQEKLIQSFENANYLRTVARPTEGIGADHQLLIDIRSFQLSPLPDPIATVEFSAKIVAKGGRIVDARIFQATVPAKTIEAPGAVAALEEAFSKAATDLVIWAVGVL
jgi:phospholipid/cholesterol/gamma-HCH transport system substrate-binding protein